MTLFCFFFFLMTRQPPSSTRTDTLFPYTTLFRSSFRADITLLARAVLLRHLEVPVAPPSQGFWRKDPGFGKRAAECGRGTAIEQISVGSLQCERNVGCHNVIRILQFDRKSVV